MTSEESDWQIVPLGPDHDRSQFACGKDDLDRWIRQYAKQSEELGILHTYVAVPKGEGRVLGHFAIRTSEVQYARVPADEVRRLPKYPLPTILLSRLAVDRSVQGKGLGTDLLMAALAKSLRVSEVAGAYLVDVVAMDDDARNFYKRFDFRELVDDPKQLFLRMSKVKKLFG
jgi:GNAT superfamily N-acetyltransferase